MKREPLLDFFTGVVCGCAVVVVAWATWARSRA